MADLNHGLCFPSEIAKANLRSDLMLWSYLRHRAHCSLVGAVEEAFEHKTFRYAKLAADAEQHRWKAKVCAVEDSSRDSFGRSSGYLTTWEFEATRNIKLSKSCQAQQKKQLSGFG